MAMKNVSFTLLFLSLIFFHAIVSEAAITCSPVGAKTAACVAFATGKAAKPSPQCCSGLRQLAQSAKSVYDKKGICRCLKTLAKSLSGVQDKFLSQIPTSCNIEAEFPVSLKTNCETIY